MENFENKQEEFHARPVPAATDILPVDQPPVVNLPETTTLKRNIIGGIAIAAAVAAFIFEQSPANEALRTTAAFNVLDDTESPFISGSAVAGITMAIEMGSSTLAAAGFHFEKERMQKFINKFKKPDSEGGHIIDSEDQETKSKSKEIFFDTGTALGFGAAIVIARKRFIDTERTFKDDILTGTKASAVIAGVSGLIGYLATGGVDNADKIGLEKPAEVFVKYATDWKVWAAVFGSLYIAGKTKGWIEKINNRIKDQ